MRQSALRNDGDVPQSKLNYFDDQKCIINLERIEERSIGRALDFLKEESLDTEMRST